LYRKSTSLRRHHGWQIRFKDFQSGKFSFSANGQIIGTSQMYSSAAAMKKEIALVKANAASAIEDSTH